MFLVEDENIQTKETLKNATHKKDGPLHVTPVVMLSATNLTPWT